MHDMVLMASVDDLGDGADDGGGGGLGVLATGEEAIKELTTLAEVHDKVDGVGVLEGSAEADDVGVVGEGGQDGDLTTDVLDVDGGSELELGDGFAGKEVAGGEVGAEVGDAELAAAELAAEGVVVEDAQARVEVFEDLDRVWGVYRILGKRVRVRMFVPPTPITVFAGWRIRVWFWIRIRVVGDETEAAEVVSHGLGLTWEWVVGEKEDGLVSWEVFLEV